MLENVTVSGVPVVPGGGSIQSQSATNFQPAGKLFPSSVQRNNLGSVVPGPVNTLQLYFWYGSVQM